MSLRPYQQEAISAFVDNGSIGVLNMATGTGKTLTSIAAVNQDYALHRRQCLVIIVPFTHLVAQWEENLRRGNIYPDLRIMGASERWRGLVPSLIWQYQHHMIDRLVLIGTYKSICSQYFEEAVASLRNPDTFLLADECHYIGAAQSQRESLFKFKKRLGLSATPARWWDEDGTNFIRRLFGPDVFVYSMQQAIDAGYLTPYTYQPIIIRLDSEEEADFDRLTTRINKLLSEAEKKTEAAELLKTLLLRRTRIIRSAAGKMIALEAQIMKQADPHFTLVYCANIRETQAVLYMLSQRGIRAHQFDSTLSLKQREEVLARFAAGEICVLVAVKCLDEGVDIPDTRVAYFLASTSNPREFVQRRGRILRRAPDKQRAEVYDFVVMPPVDYQGRYAENLVRHELPRVFELNANAMNKYGARDILTPVLRQLQLERYLDLSSQDIYLESLRKRDGYDVTA
ncbi:DEAD/DEAH box helicase family protein (plasmid) [Lactiplantibacillus plantarum]|uniref:DEAD/DEAH box helicase family protein n=1 Tax=Lactiplantibacillus plantarum TaxID=1590 RepID=UPI001F4220F4|nr:DEAD/DEAH box helicase family protein [Lactiplantibacillus plantarum]MCG0724117.1 DNA repair helicase [Lactiplantibacillus plantarum]UJL26236.1 DEAD/DEAH box helicase family protein [Lactiplantibacillus plantarum]